MKSLLFALILIFSHNLFAGLTPINEIFSPNDSQFPLDRYQKVAVLQWANPIDAPVNVSNTEAENYKQTNREAIADYIEEADRNNATLLVTPEMATVGYPSQPEYGDNFSSPEQAAPYAEEKKGITFQYFSKLAKQFKMFLHIGFLEKVPGERFFHNSVMVISPKGDLVTTYSKQNLFGGEYLYIKPGVGAKTYQSPAGKMGLGVCADIYDTSFLAQYKKLKIDALSLSSSWTIHNSAYSYYTSAAETLDTIIMGSNHNYYPDSGVVNADGSKQSHIRQSTGLAYGFLPLK